MFSAGSLTRGSIYVLLNVVLPLPNLIGWMARKMPDKRLIHLLEVGRHAFACWVE